MTATHTGDRHRPALVTLSQLSVHLRRCRRGGGDLSLVPQVVVDGLDCYQALLYQLDPESGQLTLTATSRPALFEKQCARLEAGAVVACQAFEDRQIAVAELTVTSGEGNDETYSQWLACPIFSAQDTLLGVLEVELPRAVDATQRHLFQLAADLLAEHLGQVDLHDRIFRSNVYLAQLNDITQQLSTHQDIDAMVDTVAVGLAEMMGIDEIALYLMENAVPRLVARGGRDETLPADIRVSSVEGATILGDEDSPGVTIGTCILDGDHLITELLRSGGGGAHGILLLRKRSENGPFDSDQQPLLSALSTHLCTAVQNAQLLREVQRQATYDDLTGLVGRRHFLSEMKRESERARREKQPLALLMIDADNFKLLNDTHGHPAGDAVLKALARELIKGTRAVDLVGRLGGEEVAVLLPGASNEVAVSVAERLREGVQKLQINWDNEVLQVTISIGVTSLGPEMAAEEFLAQADRALYAAKDQGRDRVVSQYDLPAVGPAHSD
jgi:diguanylate cyclase (GGDEF)-like protein